MNPIKVLLVDDEKTFIDNLAILLEKRDYRAVAAYSGNEAIRLLSNEVFDIVVVDLKMPGMDGIATLKEIKKMNKPPEILMLTGHGSMGTALEAVKLGAYDYLAKPCEINELIEKFQEIENNLKTSKKKKSILAFKNHA